MKTPRPAFPFLRSGPDRRPDRGSALVVALLLAVLIAIALASFLRSSNTSLDLAQRNFLDNSAMNLAELGLERALYCLNQNQTNNVALATAWSGWTVAGHNATHTFSGFTPAPGSTGVVKVYAENYDLGRNPLLLVAKCTVTPGTGGPPLSKFIEVTLAKRQVAAGLVAKTSITGDSNLYVDSWQSNPTNAAPGTYTPVLYSTAIRRANGPLGVVSAVNDALSTGDNPTIYGTVNTGGGAPLATGAAVLSNVVGGTGWANSLVNTTFSYTWPTVAVPSPSAVNAISANITTSVSFPRPGDVAASDGKYYYNFAPGVGIVYAADTLTINQPCVFLMNGHTGTNVIFTSDHAAFTYGANGALDLYTDGNLDFDAGANFFADKAPALTNIYGTSVYPQTFLTRGGGTFYGNIQAQNANVTFDSGVDIMGALAVNSITMLGGDRFHYDESLGQEGGGGYKVSKWKELRSASERAAYAGAFNF